MLRTKIVFVLLVSALGVPETNSPLLASGFDLSRSVKKTLDNEVFPAMKSGNDVYFYNSFGPILSKAPSERVVEIEKYAKSLNLESPIDHFISLKLMRVEQGIDAADARLRLSEASILIGGINKRLKRFFESVDAHPFMADPVELPEAWKKARDQFWDAHVIRNEFSNNEKLLRFGTAMLLPLRSAIDDLKDDGNKAILEQFQFYLDNFARKYEDLEERVNEARLIRFNRSADVLLGDKQDFEKKFIGALSLQMDAEGISKYLASNIPTREALQTPGLLTEMKAKFDHINANQAVLLKKAYLLKTGLHWWLRGRYGHGAERGGLLKSENVFVDLNGKNNYRVGRTTRGGTVVKKTRPAWSINWNELNALYMPRSRPKPEFSLTQLNDATDSQSKHYNRRHYYTWALEYRPLETQSSSRKKTIHSEVLGSETIHSKMSVRNADFFW